MTEQEEFGEGIEIIDSEAESQLEYASDMEVDDVEDDEVIEGGENEEEEEEDDGVSLDRLLHDMVPHSGEPVYSIDVHPIDKTLLVTGGGDDCARILRYEHMTEEWTIVSELGEKSSDSIISVRFNHDGSLTASGGMDGAVKIFKSSTGEMVHCFEGPNEVVWIDWHPKGNVIVAGAEDGMIWMWNADSGVCMHVFSGNASRSIVGQFSPDGKWLVSTGEGIVTVWNPKEGKAELVYDRAQGHPIPECDLISLAINPSSTLIAVGSAEGHLAILRLLNHQVVYHLQGHTDAIEGLAFAPKLNYLVSGGLDSRLIMWDLNTFTIRHRCETVEDEEISGLKWLSNPDTFITSSVCGLVSVWDGRSGARLDQFGLREAPCLAVAPIPSKQLMFCAYESGRIVSFAYN